MINFFILLCFRFREKRDAYNEPTEPPSTSFDHYSNQINYDIYDTSNNVENYDITHNIDNNNNNIDTYNNNNIDTYNNNNVDSYSNQKNLDYYHNNQNNVVDENTDTFTAPKKIDNNLDNDLYHFVTERSSTSNKEEDMVWNYLILDVAYAPNIREAGSRLEIRHRGEY